LEGLGTRLGRGLREGQRFGNRIGEGKGREGKGREGKGREKSKTIPNMVSKEQKTFTGSVSFESERTDN
jgi:hypothetical protein